MLALFNTLGRALRGLFIFLLLFSHLAHSAELRLLLGQEHWRYQEVDDFEHELNREQGALPQLQAALLLPIAAHWHLHSALTYNQGTLDYIGQTQAGTPHNTQTDTSNFLWQGSGRYYWQRAYLGGGVQYQYWQREIQAANNVSHLHEYYRWFGPQLELGYLYPLTSNLELELGLSGAWLNGEMEVDLTAVPSTNNRSRNFGEPRIKLRNGYQANAFLLIKIQLNQQLQLLFNYQQSYRYFPKSADTQATDGQTQLLIHEPESTNSFYHYATGISYSF